MLSSNPPSLPSAPPLSLSQVTLWDTGGLERYNSMTANYFRYCNAVILVYDASPDRLETLFALRDWITDVTKHSSLSDKVALSLWANKCDLSDTRRPPEVDAFMQEHRIPEHLYFRMSAKTGEGLMSAFHDVILHVDRRGNLVSSTGCLIEEPGTSGNSGRSTRRTWRDRCRC